MISLGSSRLSRPSAAFLSSKPPLTSTLSPLHKFQHKPKPNQRRIVNGIFKAELSQDAPLAVAIGACVLNSLVFPIVPEPDDEDDDGEESQVISTTDARFAVMGIISFIPYFNWTSWVFAWLDTGKQRYLVYSLVYLAPYLRTNLSLSPEESWLPIASILFCIIHIQLEASIRNGDLQAFQLFRGLADNYSITAKRKGQAQSHDGASEEEQTKECMNLPSARDQSGNEIQGWGVPERPLSDVEQSNEDGDASNRRRR